VAVLHVDTPAAEHASLCEDDALGTVIGNDELSSDRPVAITMPGLVDHGARSQPLLHDGLGGDDGIEELVSLDGSAQVCCGVSALSSPGRRKASLKDVGRVDGEHGLFTVRFPWFCLFSRWVTVKRDRPYLRRARFRAPRSGYRGAFTTTYVVLVPTNLGWYQELPQ